MLERKKIALFLPDLRVGGAERMRVRLANELSLRGHDVQIVVRRAQGELIAQVSESVTIVDLHASRVRHALGALARYLRAEKPDVILTAMWPLTLVSIIATRMSSYRFRVVISEHTTLTRSFADSPWLLRCLLALSTRLLYPLADAIVAVSQGVADDLSRLSGMAIQRITVIHNPVVRVDTVKSQSPAAHRPGQSPVRRIVAVGNLKPAKDYPTLLQAFALLVQSPRTELCILGDGPLRASLELQAAKLGVSDKVYFLGHIEDPRPYLLDADLFVLSSRWEGFPNVLVEALDCGLPIVSTDCQSGPREILAAGAFGTLVPIGEPEVLRSAIQNALEQPCDRQRQRERALEFSVTKSVDRYLAVLMGEGQSSP